MNITVTRSLLRTLRPVITAASPIRTTTRAFQIPGFPQKNGQKMSDSNKDSPSKHPSQNDFDTSELPHDEKKEVHKNRMDRPPYSEVPDKDFKKIYDASCFCGSVKYEIAAEKPLDAKFCHCPTCQRLHGAPFQWAAIFRKTDVRFTSGKENLIYWVPDKKSQEYILPCKVSCRSCRTPIMDEGRNMLLLFPTLVHFSDLKSKRKFYPSCHIFYSRRAIDVLDGLPKFAKHKDESDLIPEKVEENTEKQESEHHTE